MSNFGFYSNKSSIPFENHLQNLEEHAKVLLVNIRNFVKSFDENVIEETRPHRIVYAKSLTFRYFLDIQPRNDALVISIRKSRKEPPTEYLIKNINEFESIKLKILEAYSKI